MIEKVTWNKSSLLLKIKMENSQTLKLFSIKVFANII